MAERQVHDLIIVGAGPAGCVLANRLTEDPNRTVLLLEAGPDYGADPADWPAEFRDPTSVWPDSHPWGYFEAGRPAERPLPLPRTRVVGGTSTVNGCIWLRGSAADYDGWAAAGNPGWSFADVLPFARRAESDPLAGPLHGTAGPVPVARVDSGERSPVDRAFVAAAEAVGLPFVADLNGAPDQSPGVGPTPKNLADGQRMNAAFTYLAPARDRPNLTIVPDTLIDRVVVENGLAIGVRAADGRVFRGKETVLCAGAYGSPAILLRSGVGPAAELRRHGIAVVADRPGVGENLFDHPLVNDLMWCAVMPEQAPAATTFMPVMIKARSCEAISEIDLHVYQGQSFDDAQGSWVFWLSVSLQNAQSRGRVRLTSADPAAAPAIDHAYFADPVDLENLCDGVELVTRLIATPPLSAMVTPMPELAGRWRDRDGLRTFVRAHVGTTFHPSSTCAMGPAGNSLAVVDHAGRVHGVDCLRVVDASIFPTGPRCNLHFPTVIAAEKIADAIQHPDPDDRRQG